MIQTVNSELKIALPQLSCMVPFPKGVTIVNANPQCGPFPLTNMYSDRPLCNQEEEITFQGDLSQDFIREQILPRGRPHFSLLHVALVDDSIAVASLTGMTKEIYGIKHRYIETKVSASFHKEAFMSGTMDARQFGTVFVEGFRVRWKAQKEKDRVSIIDRGLFQVSIYGLRDSEEILISSVEGHYMKRRAVLNRFSAN